MAKQTINLGSGDSRGDGESVRSAFDKCNDNFTELYTSVGSAFDGAYSSLTGKPTIPADVSDLTDTTNLLTHFDGAYSSLTGTPTIPTVPTLVSAFANDAGYLTSFTETNDLSAAVTWANVPDANITESSVTQHQAALTITESQISDLGSYITGYTVTESDVTAHQAALTITESQISDLQSYLTAISVTTDSSNADEPIVFVPSSGNKSSVRIDSDNKLTYNPSTNTITLNSETITGTKIGQWDTAYSWGDHSTEGYLTSESGEASTIHTQQNTVGNFYLTFVSDNNGGAGSQESLYTSGNLQWGNGDSTFTVLGGISSSGGTAGLSISGGTVDFTGTTLVDLGGGTIDFTGATVTGLTITESQVSDLGTYVESDTTGITGADQVTNIVTLTQAEYDAIGSPNASTVYIIVG